MPEAAISISNVRSGCTSWWNNGPSGLDSHGQVSFNALLSEFEKEMLIYG